VFLSIKKFVPIQLYTPRDPSPFSFELSIQFLKMWAKTCLVFFRFFRL